jgi:hypothetical protein
MREARGTQKVSMTPKLIQRAMHVKQNLARGTFN